MIGGATMKISQRDFNKIASVKVEAKTKREAPFSLRLSFEEKAALKKMAAGEPLGAYIKAVLFDEAQTGVRRGKASAQDGKCPMSPPGKRRLRSVISGAVS